MRLHIFVLSDASSPTLTPSCSPVPDPRPRQFPILCGPPLRACCPPRDEKSLRPFSDNCFYYAGTIVKVLQVKYNPSVVMETTESHEVDKARGRWV